MAKDSEVETFCALRLFIDSWRWAGVPRYLRSGKCLPETVFEIMVELKPPPQQLFADSSPADGPANYLRFRLAPEVAIALAARVKRAGEEFLGHQRELFLLDMQPNEEAPYERLLGDAMAGDGALFTREDAVEAAWTVVDPVLAHQPRAHPYKPGTWGPKQADKLIAPHGRRHNPTLATNALKRGAAPGKIERPAQDKVKTDQRDAERVLRLLMINALCPVRVPTVEEEAIRDLVRAREDVRGDLMRSRQRLSKLLLRHGIVYEDTSSTWTARHRAWVGSQDLGGGAQATLLDYMGAIDTLEHRRGQLEATIGELVPSSPYAQTVARLRCLRGIDTLSAVGLAAEIGELTRFERPGKL